MLYIMMQSNVPSEPIVSTSSPEEEVYEAPVDPYEQFKSGLATLTITEKKIFDLYLLGKSTKEVADEVGIKENTVKFHNKNLYTKLGVTSRKQLVYYAMLYKDEKNENE